MLLGCDVVGFLMSLGCDVRRERENEIRDCATMSNWLRKPSQTNCNLDSPKDRGAMHAKLFCDDVVAWAALPAAIAMEAQPGQNKPMHYADPLVVEDAAHPVEALEPLLARAHDYASSRSRS
jgi:hypothetical protein